MCGSQANKTPAVQEAAEIDNENSTVHLGSLLSKFLLLHARSCIFPHYTNFYRHPYGIYGHQPDYGSGCRARGAWLGRMLLEVVFLQQFENSSLLQASPPPPVLC